jgi:hypothetical protein
VIVAAIIGAVVALGVVFLGALPDVGEPSDAGLSQIQTGIASVIAKAASLGVWLPFGAAGSALLVIMGVFAVTTLIHFARMVLSLLTGGGGNAS